MIFDLHNDLPTSGLPVAKQRMYIADTVHTVIYAVWTTECKHPLTYLRKWLSETGIRHFSVEDMGFVSEETLPALCALRPLYCTLTHNDANALAGGALSDGLLTPLGKTAVRCLDAAGIAIDVAHLNRKSFFAVADMSARLIDSHTGWESMCPHPRNLTDEQIKLLLGRGGIVGLTAVRDFIGGDRVEAYIRLIDTFVQAYGIDGACIGTDFYGTKPLTGLSSYDDFALVSARLERLGYTDADIDKIFYVNAKNYFHL